MRLESEDEATLAREARAEANEQSLDRLGLLPRTGR